MRFAECFDIEKSEDGSDDWFNVLVDVDTPLFIDPFLIWEEKHGFWQGAHAHLIEFFTMVFTLIGEAKGDKKNVSWKQAENLLVFPEPAEFRFGVAEGSPFGSGSSKGLQSDVLGGITAATRIGMRSIAHMETISLFQGGMGPDRIGDAVSNVLKSYFIRYTQDIARKHQIPTKLVTVPNASWSVEQRRWKEGRVELPVTIVRRKSRGREREIELPVILTPERFLRELPVAESNGFWTWSWAELGAKLRADFNYDVARNVTKDIKAKLARDNPEAVALYLLHLEGQPKDPYPVAEDPHLLVTWYEKGKQMARREIAAPEVETDQGFTDFVAQVVEEYRHSVESDAWRLLWTTGRGAKERDAQVLFRSIVRHYCRANNVDLSGEADAGRGPVDFKFSQGWDARALVEIKLARNTSFWDGLAAQTPTYQWAEGVRTAFFVAIAYKEEELSKEFRAQLQQGAKIVSEQRGVLVRAVLVDATRKSSASKEKDADLKREIRNSSDETKPERQ